MSRFLKNFLLEHGLVPQRLLEYKSQSRNAAAIADRRIALGRQFNSKFNGFVKYGLFSGLQLGAYPTWAGFSDKSSQLFGLYEQEILKALEVIEKRDVFINLGAADGYYANGMIVAEKVAKSYAYEIDLKSRDVLLENAKLNGIADKIVIRGEVFPDFYKDFKKSELDNSIILSDIEGGEFAVFNRETFYNLRFAIILIEIHDWVYERGTELLANMISNAEVSHKVEMLKTSVRDLSQFDELKDLSDDDRWIICSEGRPKLMSWLLLTPKPK